MAAWYNRGKQYGGLAGLNLRALLVNSGYVFNPDHNVASDVNAFELSGTGYQAGFAGTGRKSLNNMVFAQDNVGDRYYLDCDNLVWSAINAGTVGGLIVYIHAGGSDAASDLIAFVDTGGFPLVTTGANLAITISPLGLLEMA